jgi:ATP-dependent DNA helicase RecG
MMPNLNTELKEFFKLNQNHKKALDKLGLKNIGQILYYFPIRYGDTAMATYIEKLDSGTNAILYGKISKLKTGKTFRGHIPKAEANFSDETGKLKLLWFNQPYIAKIFEENALVKIEGKISVSQSGIKSILNPHIEKIKKIPDGIGDSLFGQNNDNRLSPIYSESKGITSNWFYHALQKIFKSGILDQIDDSIPAEILEKYKLPKLKTALIWIHTPKNERDALSARKRFAFEEIFYIQLAKKKERHETDLEKTYEIKIDKAEVEKFIARFPFSLTDSQQKSIQEILHDISTPHAMSRLIEGDVGSGKTAVASVAVHSIITSKPKNQNFGNLQVAYMVPTEILAKQHFENFIKYFEKTGIQVGLITSSGCKKFPSKVNPAEWTNISRPQLSKWVENGEIPIVIGTHALIQKSIKFKHLALVIIDEQHRFGINQRQKIAKKDSGGKYQIPHLLSMTATPIPRTLALTIYGDLDLTIIDQMPAGRKPIITEIVLPDKREAVYKKVEAEIFGGRQAYVICPRIEEADPNKQKTLLVKSVKAEAKRLREKIFPNFKIAEMHSKMTNLEKEKIMGEFEQGEINILVSTSVIEVGVNVPNATIILIEGAERFGLAQLHQLRGRVIRSNHQAYCYIFTDSYSEKTVKRLGALKDAKNGFELSEFDLKLRGAGELSGKKQWGISDLGMEAIKNIKMVEAARSEAETIIFENLLPKYSTLLQKIEERKDIHFE